MKEKIFITSNLMPQNENLPSSSATLPFVQKGQREKRHDLDWGKRALTQSLLNQATCKNILTSCIKSIPRQVIFIVFPNHIWFSMNQDSKERGINEHYNIFDYQLNRSGRVQKERRLVSASTWPCADKVWFSLSSEVGSGLKTTAKTNLGFDLFLLFMSLF